MIAPFPSCPPYPHPSLHLTISLPFIPTITPHPHIFPSLLPLTRIPHLHSSLSLPPSLLTLAYTSAGWWYVARAENSKESGWVPGSFLGPPLQDVEDFIDNPEEWGDEQEGDHDHEQLYEAIADYDSGDANQLSFKEGDKVKVVDKDDDGEYIL